MMRLDRVRGVYDHPGPYVTVHLDVSRTTEDARRQLDARWTTARHDLERGCVAGEAIAELESRVREQTHLPGEVRRTVVATAGGVLFDELRQGRTVWPEVVTVGQLPDLAGWLSQSDGAVPFLLVRADRKGAGIDVYDGLGSEPRHHVEVDGDEEDLTKLPEGDWAQKEYQQRAENTWKRNAELVAEQVRSQHAHFRPRVVVLAGDVRAKALLAEQLENLQADVATVDSGGRAAGASDEALWDDVRELLASYRAHDQADIAERLDRGRARGQGAATGLDEVVEALVRAEVERLVLDLSAARELRVSPADHPGLAVPAQVAESRDLPADQVLVAAAAATGAEVSLLPRELAHGGGVSATLRY
jgi:hypothetical protein